MDGLNQRQFPAGHTITQRQSGMSDLPEHHRLAKAILAADWRGQFLFPGIGIARHRNTSISLLRETPDGVKTITGRCKPSGAIFTCSGVQTLTHRQEPGLQTVAPSLGIQFFSLLVISTK